MKLLTILSAAKQAASISDDNFIGIFLYGSQNYNLSTDDSDVDAIMLVHSADKAKSEINLKTGKIKIYTLKYFIYRLKQGDLECYEILYTKHKIINPIYKEHIKNFTKEFSSCMNYNRIKYSLYKKLDEHLSHVLWMMKNPEKARYNKKRLYWAMRVYNQLCRISNGENFESSLIYQPLNGYDLIKIKSITNYLSFKQFNEIYKNLKEYLLSSSFLNEDVSEKEEQCLSNFYSIMS